MTQALTFPDKLDAAGDLLAIAFNLPTGNARQRLLDEQWTEAEVDRLLAEQAGVPWDRAARVKTGIAAVESSRASRAAALPAGEQEEPAPPAGDGE